MANFCSYRAMCGKTVEIFSRKCLLLKALHVACDELCNIPGCNEQIITPEFAKKVEERVNVHDSNRYIISDEIASYALNLTEHFHKTKLILANYHFDPKKSLEEIIKNMFKEYENSATLGGIFVNLPDTLTKQMQKVLMSDFTVPRASDIAGGNGHVEIVAKAMKELEKVGLGNTFYTKSKNQKSFCSFKKITTAELSTNRELAQKIQELGLSLAEYISHMQKIEQQEAHTQTLPANLPHNDSSVKRCGDVIEASVPKKQCNAVITTSTRGGGAPFLLSSKNSTRNPTAVHTRDARSNSTQLQETSEAVDNSLEDLSNVINDSVTDPNYRNTFFVYFVFNYCFNRLILLIQY